MMYRMNSGSTICRPAASRASAKTTITAPRCGFSQRRYSRRNSRCQSDFLAAPGGAAAAAGASSTAASSDCLR